MKDTLFYSKKTLNFKGILRVYEHPLVMGIINATPDSFYSGSRSQAVDQTVERAGKMIADGADMVDLGGYSSRPGAADVSEAEELERVIPAIREIHQAFPDLIISVDTFRSRVADEALQNGASLINDISGGQYDERIFEVAASHRAPYVLMHMRGTPQTMSGLTRYDNFIGELMAYFSARIEKARKAGVNDLILDPGFGFSKTIEQNFELLRRLEEFHLFGWPLLVGVSRKSTIYKTLGISPENSLNGSTVLHTAALLKGASVLRVHDVREAKEAVQLVAKLL